MENIWEEWKTKNPHSYLGAGLLERMMVTSASNALDLTNDLTDVC
ncbi:hypothetical protein ABHN05_15270 [Brevibacillus laterosporus]